ncbi:MAG: leucine-rich repeat protein [Clostridia bacterium]|nr:leucine-rich repeat protein [Clostridia bacterium]
MRRKHLLPLAFIAIILFCALAIPAFPAESAAEEIVCNADTYYYDRINERAKICYTLIKGYYDNRKDPSKKELFDVSHLLAQPATMEDYHQLFTDIVVADQALKADHPRYELMGTAMPSNTNPPLRISICITERVGLITDESLMALDSRIDQIVSSIGEGDRYTKLRKLATYILENQFYDPYFMDLAGPYTQISYFNSTIYGLLTHNSVCGGFAGIVKTLCNELDIPCIIIGNYAHAWNLIQMENGKWYRLDMTNACRVGWDDQLPQEIDKYFLETFLSNNGWGDYRDPYMIAIDNVKHVTDFPETEAEIYKYEGQTKDFTMTLVPEKYTPEATFLYRVNNDNKTCTVIGYVGPQEGALTIPTTLDGYTVTAIDHYAFYRRDGFSGKLTIPDTVTFIGRAAFGGCYRITSVDLPSSLYHLGSGAFIGCVELTKIELPDLLEDIEHCAFLDCRKLTQITFGRHIKSVGNQAFDKTSDKLVIHAPKNSAAHDYASQNKISFTETGTLCTFNSENAKYVYDNENHYYICEHGGRFGLGQHKTKDDQIYFNCTEECVVCGVQYCKENGFVDEITLTLTGKTEATCSTEGYTGDMVCICGKIIEQGSVIDPTNQHKPQDEDWEYTEQYHYQACACDKKLDVGNHYGGTASDDGKASCAVCGAEYTVSIKQKPSDKIDLTIPIVGGGIGVVAVAAVVIIIAVKKSKSKKA